MISTYQSGFQPSDESIPYRLVGSYEYLNALKQFMKLIEISTTDEIKVYDKILNKRAEFSFFSGVNTAFNEKPDLAKANPFERQKFNDDFIKKGLAWMMALARIELAATSSLYGDVKQPFTAIEDSQFDAEPYLKILQDDVVAHMRSLAQEPGFTEVLRRSRTPDTWTLAYLRRIKLIRDMLQTLQDVGGPSVQAEIEPLAYELRKHQRNLVEQVESATVSSGSEYAVKSGGTRISRQQTTTVGQCKTFVDNNLGSGSATPATGSSPGGSNLVRTGR